MMFNVAMSHMMTLKSISVDQLVNQSAWSYVLKKLAAEWKDVTFYVRITALLCVLVRDSIFLVSLCCY
jgi:hypothetical protein